MRTQKLFPLGVLCVLCALCICLVMTAVNAAEAQRRALLAATAPARVESAEGIKAPVHDEATVRARAVEIDTAALDAAEALIARGATAPIEIAFFSDAVVGIDLSRVERPHADVIEYYGHVNGDADGWAILVRHGKAVDVQAVVHGHSYRVQYRGTLGHEATEENASLRKATLAAPLAVPSKRTKAAKAQTATAAKTAKAPATGAAVQTSAAQVDDGSILDVLFVYTPQAAADQGGDAAMVSFIDATVAAANQVYNNSNTNTRLRRVQIMPLTGYQETEYSIFYGYTPIDNGQMLTELRNARTTPGRLSIVHDWRNTYAADIVVMVSSTTLNYVCGISGFMGIDDPTFEQYAFSVIGRPCMDYHTLSHETGHILGVAHDRYEYRSQPDSDLWSIVAGQQVNYGFGYADPANRVMDVMAYGNGCAAQGFNCTIKPYYSNPDINVDSVTHPGTPVPIGAANANGAAVIRQTRNTVANFRVFPRTQIGFNTTQASVAESAGSVTLTFSRTGGSSQDPASVSYRTVDLTAQAGSDYTAVSGSHTWLDQQTGDFSITVPILRNPLNGGRKRFNVVLENASNAILINAVATVAIDSGGTDVFPRSCQMPAGWFTPVSANAGWAVDTGEASEGQCTLKSQPISDGQSAEIAYTGTFKAGEIQFRRRVHSEAGWDFFRFKIDGVEQGPTCAAGDDNCSGATAAGATASGSSPDSSSGATEWNQPGLLRYPVSAGTHTITFSYQKDAECCAQGADAAWIDAVVLPLADNLNISVTGSGKVTSAPTGIDCGSTCSLAWTEGTPVLLTATPSSGAQFTSWSNCPSAVGNQCFAIVGGALSVVASFTTAPTTVQVAVTLAGAGSGSVSSTPAGITCGAGCSAAFTAGASLTLTATPTGGSTFAGWSGTTCSGGNTALTCTFSPSANVTVTATFNAAATAPGAPVITSITPGDGSATIYFNAPASNGGATITQYTATCNPGAHTATGTSSPIVVTGLTNGATYTCTVTATNSAGTGSASSSSSSVPTSGIGLSAVQSRKTHGSMGDFDIAIDTTRLIDGLVTVEPRVIGTGHRIVFQFDRAVAVIGTVTTQDINGAAIGTIATAISGNELTVTLTGVADVNRVAVFVNGVNGTLNVSAAIGFLVGDVNNSRSVNASDINGVKARSGEDTNAGNFKFDLNASGAINTSDISTVKARSGNVL